MKSEVIQFSTMRGRNCVDDAITLRVSDASIQPSSTVKSLGVTLDQKLSFDKHISTVCKQCFCHIRALRHVRDSLPDDVARTVACSIVGSRLDYCNSLLVGTSKSNIAQLQRVQNTQSFVRAVKYVVLRRGKYQHIKPALAELHWLPINERITFKTATLTYKIKTTGHPIYLRNLLPDYEPVRELRSSSKQLLQVHAAKTVLASRGFSHSAARIWNSLPFVIKNSTRIYNF
jgi:hypothetical protein